MIIELFVTMFIVTYVTIVIVGHALLFVAVLKCLREGDRGTGRRPAEIDRRSAADRTVMPALAVSVRNGLRI
jgi:hypothetical protein